MLFENKSISEDEKFTQKDEIEKSVKSSVDEVEKMGDAKSQEIMTV